MSRRGGLTAHTPYTANPLLAKRWKTRANAQRWLDRKDPLYAESCAIVELPEDAKGNE